MFIDQVVVDNILFEKERFEPVTHLLPQLYTDGMDHYIVVE